MTFYDLTNPNIDLNGIKGEITQADIDHGVCRDHEACALARAVERMLPSYTVFVDDYICVNDQRGEIVLEMAITEKILKWIDRFDNEKTVKPIPLVILPSIEGANKWILCSERQREM